MRTTEWVLLDTETSGLGQPIYCVELAAQRMRGINPDGPPFRALLNHDVEIEPQAEALHGYSRPFLRANGRDPVEVHREFNAYAGTRPVVAYNLSFDWARVLEPELGRLRMAPAYTPGFCALTLARRCVHETSSHKLDALRSHFFPAVGGASHHALDDVEITRKLILEIIWPRLEQAGIESFSAVADFSRKTPVRVCLDRIRNPKSASPAPTGPAALDAESELVTTIEGMLADDQIVDAEVWALKHWLDNHAGHQSELAERARAMITAAFTDGALSSWELDDIKIQLGRLVGYVPQRSRARQFPAVTLRSQPSEPVAEKKRRLSLTKRQLEEECGIELLNLLGRIVADGVLSDGEIEELTNWLLENQSGDLPAIGHLIDVVKEILADGKITDSERVDLFLGIEKVLPVTERRTAKAAREQAEASAEPKLPPKLGRDELKTMAGPEELPRSTRSASWRDDPMTDAQRAFIGSLGGSIRSGATKGEASQLIETLLGNKPITSRQQMVMRFWARERQPGEGSREISEWMDDFYREDGDRKLAWELFKNESEDNGLQGDPNRVPLGVGSQYLARIKTGEEAAVPKFRAVASATFHRVGGVPLVLPKKSGGKRKVIAAIIAATVLVAAVLLIRRDTEPLPAPSASTPPLRTETFPANDRPPIRSSPAAPGPARDDTQTIVRRLRITGLIGGARPRVSVEGNLLGIGDAVDAPRGILVHSINADTRTITFIDVSGKTYSRTLD